MKKGDFFGILTDMYITVRLLNGFFKPLTYRVPALYRGQDLVGRIVQVPLRKQLVYGVVCEQFARLPAVDFAVRDLETLGAVPPDARYNDFVERVASYYQLDRIQLLKRLQQVVDSDEVRLNAQLYDDPQNTGPIVQLTPEQQAVVDALLPAVASGQYVPALLHGVTGSGKTEVYKKLIVAACQQGKTALVLFPEVTLALQFARLFKDVLPAEIPVVSFHSACTKKEKDTAWTSLCQGRPLLLLGVHLPVLLPIANLGLIIVDEEHEVGYQEKKHPKLNTKEVALMRAHMYHVPIVLGSATPSLTSLHQVRQGRWRSFCLTERYTGSFPQVRVVRLGNNRLGRRNFWISAELEFAIAERLNRREQSIVFLNRRGLCFFVQCDTCSHIVYCQNCSVSMTLHQDQQLYCHYCGARQPMPVSCPECRSGHFVRKGIGTQQLVPLLQKMFPTARIARADLDITSKKNLWTQTVRDMIERRIDILVGTQTITKGYHFPGVTLVGIIWADLNVHFPIYNAAETSLQQLVQVAGRAGRASLDGEVIVQTLADHPIYAYLNERDYDKFYEREITIRELLSYPPCGRLVELELVHDVESVVDRDAQVLVHWLLERKPAQVQVLGPTAPMVSKIKNTFRRTIFLKAPSFAMIGALYQQLSLKKLASRVYFTPNPLS